MAETPKLKTRYAPSPTGALHIGALRTILWDYLIARKAGGIFTLRLEDTDRTRLVAGSYEGIVSILKRFGLEPDEGPAPFPDLGNGPYVQSERLDIYPRYARKMLDNGSAYYCFCDSERLDEVRKEQEAAGLPTRYDGHCRHLDPAESAARVAAGETHVVRLKVPKGETVSLHDAIRGKIEFPTSDVDDQVLMKSDGFPTYHLGVVVDDHLMGVTHVLRGEEWIPSTPKQILIARGIGVELPIYAHVPVILGDDRKKLSKRTGDTAVEQYFQHGYLPEAIINYIAFLWWNPKTTEEIFSLDELVERFDLADVQKAGGVFSRDKLDWTNAQYIMRLPLPELESRLAGYLREYVPEFYAETYSVADPAKNLAILSELRTRLKRLEEYPELTKFFYAEPAVPALEMFCNEKMKVATRDDVVLALRTGLDILATFDSDALDLEETKTRFLAKIAEIGRKNGQILWPIRTALSGEAFSPGAFELMAILGRDQSRERLGKVLAFLISEG